MAFAPRFAEARLLRALPGRAGPERNIGSAAVSSLRVVLSVSRLMISNPTTKRTRSNPQAAYNILICILRGGEKQRVRSVGPAAFDMLRIMGIACCCSHM